MLMTEVREYRCVNERESLYTCFMLHFFVLVRMMLEGPLFWREHLETQEHRGGFFAGNAEVPRDSRLENEATPAVSCSQWYLYGGR